MTSAPPPEDRSGPYRLLVCDDHRVLTDALELVIRADRELELVGPPVRSAAEAVEACERLDPDVVLMDVSLLGEGTGLDATRDIRARRPTTRIVIMTAHHDERLMVEAVEAGASGYLSKTEGVDAVLAAAKAAARGEVLFDAPSLAPVIARVTREREAALASRSRFDKLTEREREVLQLLTEGLRNEDIGKRLQISPFTAQTHVSNILAKLGVRSKVEAIALALRQGSPT